MGTSQAYTWLPLGASCTWGGQMFPDHARLHMAGIEDADYKEEKCFDRIISSVSESETDGLLLIGDVDGVWDVSWNL